mgnify:CR=1 FL=1
MSILDGKKVIAIEEHYYDDRLTETFTGVDARTGGHVREALEDVGAARIKSMDEHNIDVQVLSHGAPSAQKLDADTGPAIATAINDRLKEICDAYPDRCVLEVEPPKYFLFFLECQSDKVIPVCWYIEIALNNLWGSFKLILSKIPG